MNPEEYFWWEWWVSFFIAVGTIGAVVIALFGQKFQSKIFPPYLTLSLLHPEGERSVVELTPPPGKGDKRKEEARYYHLKVSNERRWSPANQVQVFLMRIEEPGPDGEFRINWQGDLPMRWRHQEISPVTKTIGPSADCDICSIIKGKGVSLLPLITPFNLDVDKRNPFNLIVSFQARSNQVDSSIVRVQIAWDGMWDEGDQKHLVVKILK